MADEYDIETLIENLETVEQTNDNMIGVRDQTMAALFYEIDANPELR